MNRWLFCLLALFIGCKQLTIVASMQANVSVTGDTTGAASAFANVNFTAFEDPPRSDSKLVLRFTNPEGDVMEFLLSPRTTGSVQAAFPVGRYTLDGVTNTFTSTFTVYSSGAPVPITVTTTNGYIDFTTLNFGFDNSTQTAYLSDFSGSFYLNFDIGGAGAGNFNAVNTR